MTKLALTLIVVFDKDSIPTLFLLIFGILAIGIYKVGLNKGWWSE